MNLLPGHGLGFTGSQLLGFGMGAMTVTVIPVPEPEPRPRPGGVGTFLLPGYVTIHDNAYSSRDDYEIIELLSILFQVIK